MSVPLDGSYRGFELPRGCWEFNPGPLQEQHTPLSTAEPSSPALRYYLFVYIVLFTFFTLHDFFKTLIWSLQMIYLTIGGRRQERSVED